MIDLRKNFLIYGYGISGKSISKYLKRKKSSYQVYDDFSDLSSIKESINLQELKKNIKTFDYFIVSPSIKINKNHVLYPFKEKILIDLDFLSLEIGSIWPVAPHLFTSEFNPNVLEATI